MTNKEETNNLLQKFQENPPKIIGGYKKQGWAVKTLEKTSNPDVEEEENNLVTAKSVLKASDETYYPAFLTLNMENNGQIIGAYLISETEEEFELIPFELALPYTGKEESELLPFTYRTLVQIDGDQSQKNWPDFS
ncbi:hypothetical protein ACIQZM_09165 [Peribacillus sp. NPDC097206]|uniref:hypothetical protein n=1 Tax=Peribacillus sp. NPDC097206 TaxID=3364398 RepID=UPI00380CA582